MDSLPLEMTDSDLASTAVLGDSPPCEDALHKNTPWFLLKADTWKVFKDPAPIFLLHLKMNTTSTQQIYWPVFEKLSTGYPLADKVLVWGKQVHQVEQLKHENYWSEKDLYFAVRSRSRQPRQQAPISSAVSLLLVIPLWIPAVPISPFPSQLGAPLQPAHTYLWKRWPQGSFRADCMESQQMAQSSLFTASSSGVATANLQRRNRKRQKEWLHKLSIASSLENPAARKPYPPR